LEQTVRIVHGNSDNYEVKFCYLGDMLNTEDDAGAAVEVTVCKGAKYR